MISMAASRASDHVLGHIEIEPWIDGNVGQVGIIIYFQVDFWE